MSSETDPLEDEFMKIPEGVVIKEKKEEWWIIKDGKLVITYYYFPIATSKTIHPLDIKAIYFEKQNFADHIFQVKSWGMSFTPVWWACDMKRLMHADGKSYYNVIVDNGDIIKKGFTVSNIDDFFMKIRPLMAPTAIISGSFPF